LLKLASDKGKSKKVATNLSKFRQRIRKNASSRWQTHYERPAVSMRTAYSLFKGQMSPLASSQILKGRRMPPVRLTLGSAKLYGLQGFHMEVEEKAHGCMIFVTHLQSGCSTNGFGRERISRPHCHIYPFTWVMWD